MGCVTYVHNNSHQYEKLGPRGKKCIFIRYFELSKGFMFVGEEADRRMTEIESRDVVFLEEDYPTRGKIEKDFQLYEMEDPNNGAPSHSVEGLEETFNLSENSENDFALDLLLWSKIMRNLNLVKVLVNESLVVDLRLRRKHS